MSNSSPVRHKAFHGVQDGARAMHANLLKRPCACCKTRLSTARLTSYVMVSDLRNAPAVLADLLETYPTRQVPTVRLKAGLAVRIAMADSCPSCLPTMERVFAKSPSYVFTTIDRGPAASTASVACS